MPTAADRRTTSRVAWLCALFLALVVAGCGGGGGADGRSGGSAPGSTPSFVAGTVASGGPIAATIVLKDSSPDARTLTKSTASDGSFSFDVAGLTAPFVLRATFGDAGAPSVLYSISAGAGTANVTPLTSIAMRAAIGGGDLAAFFRDASPAQIAAASARMAQAAAALRAAIAPLLQRYPFQGDLITGAFTADHTGVDALLDAISVRFTGALVTIASRNGGVPLFSSPPSDPAAGTFFSANFAQVGATPPTTGAALYTLYCAGCHGALADSTRKGVSIGQVQAAIADGRGAMGFLSALPAADLQAIVATLATTPPAPTFPDPGTPSAPPSTPPDGASLYGVWCAGCHLPLAQSRKIGASTVRIQNAIAGDVGGMGGLAVLSSAEVQAIAGVLAVAPPTLPPVVEPPPTTTTTDGVALYAAKCAACHGAIEKSSKLGTSIARVQAAITANAGGMGPLSSLSVTQVQAIVTALTPTTPTPTPTEPPAPADGAALYAANCAGCHGALAGSTKAKTTLAALQAAITSNAGGMGTLSRLSASDVQAIVAALASVSPAPGPAPTPTSPDGAQLYATSCAACHGPLATSTKGQATLARIQAAVSGNVGNMGSLSRLAAGELAAIATALASVAPAAPSPADGATLYATWCSSCHGALAVSSKGQTTLAKVLAAISANTGNMASLAKLSPQELQSIVKMLSGVVPPPAPADGPGLYALRCAGCHGTLAGSAKGGTTLPRLAAAISGNVGGMATLSALTSAELQAIVAALAAVAPPVPANDGTALYATYCAGCHAGLAVSAKGGASAARIQAAISGNVGNMGVLSTLGAAQVEAIASVLAPVSPPVAGGDGASLYLSLCSGCHGGLASSTKGGATATAIQVAIAGNVGGMGSIGTLSAAQLGAIASALVGVVPPVITDGPTLYATWCASCHGALASSTKGGTTLARLQAAISANTGSMGSLSALGVSQLSAIVSSLSAIAPSGGACGSCHAIPPASGRHAKHARYACSSCHGAGYSSSSVAAATHNNRVVNIASSAGWVASTLSCSNGCHGRKSWSGSGGGDDD